MQVELPLHDHLVSGIVSFNSGMKGQPLPQISSLLSHLSGARRGGPEQSRAAFTSSQPVDALYAHRHVNVINGLNMLTRHPLSANGYPIKGHSGPEPIPASLDV